MKHALSFAAAFLILGGCATAPAGKVASESERTFEHTHYVTGLSKQDIYSRSIEWMARNFVDSKSVIEVKDPENGKIIGKGITDFKRALAIIPCRFTMMIEIKDGKFRTTYEDLTALWGEFHNEELPLTDPEYIAQVKDRLDSLDSDLVTFVSKEKKDW